MTDLNVYATSCEEAVLVLLQLSSNYIFLESVDIVVSGPDADLLEKN